MGTLRMCGNRCMSIDVPPISPPLGPRSGSGTTGVATTFPSSPRYGRIPASPSSLRRRPERGVSYPRVGCGTAEGLYEVKGRSVQTAEGGSGIERFLAVLPDDALYDFACVRRA